MSTPQNPNPNFDPNQQQPGQQPYNPQQPAPEKKKKGGCMKWGAIIAGILILILILSSVLGGDDDSDSSSSSNDNASDEEIVEESETTDYQLGETFTTGDDLAITVTGFTSTTDAMGTAYRCADVELVNNGSDAQDFAVAFDWKLQDPNGVIGDPAITGESTLGTGELAPGGNVAGSVCFDDAGAGEYKMIYEPSLSFSRETATWVAQL